MGWGTVLTKMSKFGSKVQKAAKAAKGAGKVAGKGAAKVGKGVLKVGKGVLKGGGAVVAGTLGALKYFGSIALTSLLQLGFMKSISQVWSGVVQTVQIAYSYNINATDKEIEASITANINALKVQFLGSMAYSLSWLVCGGLPGALTHAINPGIASQLLGYKDPQTKKWVGGTLTDEGRQEVLSRMTMISYGCYRSTIFATMSRAFKSARRWLKRPGHPFHDMIKAQMGEENFRKWGDESMPLWSFASHVENRIESIKDPQKRAEAEAIVENMMEGCLEGSTAFVNSLDAALAANRMAQEAMLGQYGGVTVSVGV